MLACFLFLTLVSCGGGNGSAGNAPNPAPGSASTVTMGTYTGNMVMESEIYNILGDFLGKQRYERQVIVKIQPPLTISGAIETNPFNLTIIDMEEIPLAAGQMHITSAGSLSDMQNPNSPPWLQQTWNIQEVDSNFSGKLNDPLTAQDPALATLGFNTFVTPRDEGPIDSPMQTWSPFIFNMASGKTTLTGVNTENGLTIHIEGEAIWTTNLDSPRRFIADVTAVLAK